jgi:hypothetical protein
LKFLEDSDFWKNLADLEAVPYPYCVAFNILQKDEERSHEVLHLFSYFNFYAMYFNHPDSEFKTQMQQNLKRGEKHGNNLYF